MSPLAHRLCQRGQQSCANVATFQESCFTCPSILDSNSMQRQISYIFLIYSCLFSLCLSLFSLSLSCSWICYSAWKTESIQVLITRLSLTHHWRCHLPSSHRLTCQVSSLCIKHITVVLHAVVVFNRNCIQLTQIFFGRFFISPNASLLCCQQAQGPPRGWCSRAGCAAVSQLFILSSTPIKSCQVPGKLGQIFYYLAVAEVSKLRLIQFNKWWNKGHSGMKAVYTSVADFFFLIIFH